MPNKSEPRKEDKNHPAGQPNQRQSSNDGHSSADFPERPRTSKARKRSNGRITPEESIEFSDKHHSLDHCVNELTVFHQDSKVQMVLDEIDDVLSEMNSEPVKSKDLKSKQDRTSSLPSLKPKTAAKSVGEKGRRSSMPGSSGTLKASKSSSLTNNKMESGSLSSLRSSFRKRSEANIVEQMSFSYVNNLISEGAIRDLKVSEYPAVEEADHAGNLTDQFRKEWEGEYAAKGRDADLLRVIWNIFGTRFAITGIPYFYESVLKIAQTYLLGLLLVWFQKSSGTDLYFGLFYAGLLSVVVLIQALLNQIKHFFSTR
jgi:hypothetical protein